MSLFGRARAESLAERVEKAEALLRVHEERLEELAKALKASSLAVESALDQVYHWMQRANARQRAVVQREASSEGGGAPPVNGAPSVDPISAKILARRSARPRVPEE